MLLATLLAWSGWLMVLFRVDPTEAGTLGFFLFYLTLLFGLTGVFSLVGLLVRAWIHKKELLFRLVWLSFRQGISYALLLVIALFLKAQDLFVWWNVFLLILIFTAVEYLFLTLRKKEGALESTYEGEI